MIRTAIIVMLTVATAAFVIGGILGSTLGRRGGTNVWIIDKQRTIWTRVSLPELSVHYFTTNVPEKPANGFGWLGVGLGRGPWYQKSDGVYARMMYRVSCPLWLATILLGFYPALAFIRGPLRRYRRHKHGLCVTCGYDLTGSPERCPECGRNQG